MDLNLHSRTDRQLTLSVAAIACLISFFLVALHLWNNRDLFDPDGISYLDMADAYVRGDWRAALNGVWSPLYSWLLALMIFIFDPPGYWEFTAVGSTGLFVHLLTVALLFQVLGVGFVASQSIATSVAIVNNFTLNNILTYRDMRLRWWRWVYGLTSFAIACSIGAFANVGVAAYLFSAETGWALAAIAGVIIGAVWNYAVTSVYTWKKPTTK